MWCFLYTRSQTNATAAPKSLSCQCESPPPSLPPSLRVNACVSPLQSSAPPASSARGLLAEPGASLPPPASTFLPSLFIPPFCSGFSSTHSAGFLSSSSLFCYCSTYFSRKLSLPVSAHQPTDQPTDRPTEASPVNAV